MELHLKLWIEIGNNEERTAFEFIHDGEEIDLKCEDDEALYSGIDKVQEIIDWIRASYLPEPPTGE
ncbi:hypothetical protein [Xenorhabdus bovienii]|uniref:hypothetical protein n=1 Tax=Xenorhabdus bovienii TaxID=40576 RepID=UPI0023B23128|nr:hypothetical protein [Xenorhabdus bovienii]MDE9427476.1 hypothetical protein [Xenorhabdus bovienii]